ncbi:MAG: hypothetical protein ACUVQR_04165 [Thermogutta sp.]
MSDYQTTVDRIEQALASFGAVSDEELLQLAEDYAEACNEANHRLQEIHHLIRAGERSEAIRRAEMPPKLLDTVEILDFPDRDAWTDICTLKHLPTPPELLVNYLLELNEAYRVEEGLSGLLRQHRTLALAQAPLRKRLAVLRELARAEPENPVWREDLKTFESYWLETLQREIQDHLKAKNLSDLEEILRQLEDGEWSQKPPAAIIAQCRSAVESLRAKSFRQELAEIAQLVNQALASGDPVRMEGYLRVWEERVEANPHWVDMELRSQVAEAQSYRRRLEQERQEERQRRQLLTKFESLLARSHNLRTIEHHYATLQARGVVVPDVLQQRYESITRDLRRRAAFRRQIVLVALLGTIIVAIVVVWQVQARAIESRRVADACAAIERLLADGKLDEAEQYLAGFARDYPSLVHYSQFVEAKQKVTQARTDEAKRRETLAELMQKVEASLDKIPDGHSLKKAAELARTEKEKKEIGQLQSRAEAKWSELRQLAEEQIKQRLAKINQEYDALRQSGSVSLEEELHALTRLIERLQVIADDNRQQGLNLNREISTIREQISARFLEVSQASDEEKLIRTMCAAAARGPEAYREAIKGLDPTKSVRIPISDFQLVEQELPRWNVIEEWNSLAQIWNNPATKLEDANMRNRLREAFSLVEVSPPEASSFFQQGQKRSRELFEVIERRELLVADQLTGLYREWQSPLVADSWQICFKDGRRYYSLEQPGITARVLRDKTAVTPYDMSFRRDTLASLGPAPQSALWNRIKDHLGNWGQSNWEETADSVLGEIIRFFREAQEETIEWPLAFHLLYQTWSAAKEGDVGWARMWDNWQPQLQLLRDRYPVNYDWVKAAQLPDNHYDDIRKVINGLPSAEEMLENVKRARSIYRGMNWPVITLLGLLFEDKTQVWYVRLVEEPTLADNSVLYVIDQGTTPQQIVLRRVGHWGNGRAVVEPQGTVRFYNGRPVVVLLGEEPQ